MILYGDIKESANPIGICLLTAMMTFNLIDRLKFNRADRRYGEYKAIAKKYYGDGNKYPEIARANNIANPNIISVGQKLLIP